MKEDAQLICPISYDDPDDQWKKLEPLLTERLPLRDVSWKSPISSSFVTISKLPLRFLPSSSSLFKDTDHSFRWFLSPYVYVYILVAETLEAYKVVKVGLKKWVDARNNASGTLGKSPWLIIYTPIGNHAAESYKKVFAKLCGDFYAERSGDRSVMIPLPAADNQPLPSTSSTTTPIKQSLIDAFSEMLSKMREGIVVSFQHRSFMYDGDIRRLDQTRGTALFDFRQYFLVKESLALLFQMMQLPELALVQYEELEAALSYAPAGCLPENDWPIAPSEPLKPSTDRNSTTTTNQDTSSGSNSISLTASSQSQSLSQSQGGSSSGKERETMSDAVRNGEDVMTYSINLSRMKILRNKMSLIELYKYVYARQMFFLMTLRRAIDCAKRSLHFLIFSMEYIEKRIVQALSNTRGEPAAGIVKTNLEIAVQLKQLNVWAVTAAIRVCRTIRDFSQKTYCLPTVSSSTGMSTTGNGDVNETIPITIESPSSSYSPEQQDSTYKATLYNLTEIIQFCLQRYRLLTPIPKHVHTAFTYRLITCQSDFFRYEKDDYQTMNSDGTTSKSTTTNTTNTTSSSTSTNDEQTWNYMSPKQVQAVAYFQYFHEHGKPISSSVQGLSKEVDTLKLVEDINIEQILDYLAQKLRSISHYWARIFLPEFTFSYDQDGDYVDLLRRVNLYKPNYDKGRILEVLIFLLLQKALMELYRISDRNNLSTFHQLQFSHTLFITDQYQLTAQSMHHLIMSSLSVNAKYQSVTSVYGWKDLMLQSLISLLYCARQNSNVNQYRQALGWLILYSPTTSSGKLCQSPEDLLTLWIKLLSYNNMNANTSSQYTILSKELLLSPPPAITAIIATTIANASLLSPAVSSFLLPVNSFFGLQFHPCTNRAADCPNSQDHQFLRGYELIDEEKFSTKAIPVFLRHDENNIEVEIDSKLTDKVFFSQIKFVFKKIRHESFRSSSRPITPKETSTTTISPPSLLVIQEDEICCTPLLSYQHPTTRLYTISPGKQRFILSCKITSLGDFSFDRSVFSLDYLCLYTKPLYASAMRPKVFTIQDVLDSEQSMNFDHSVVAKYFQNYPILQIQTAPHFVEANVITSHSTPPQQKDDCWIRLHFQESIIVESLSLKVFTSQRSKQTSFVPSLSPQKESSASLLESARVRKMKFVTLTTAGNVEETLTKFVAISPGSNGTYSGMKSRQKPKSTQSKQSFVTSSSFPSSQDKGNEFPLLGSVDELQTDSAELHISSPMEWTATKLEAITNSEEKTSEHLSVPVPIIHHDSYKYESGKYIQLQQLGRTQELAFRIKYSACPKTILPLSESEGGSLFGTIHYLIEGNLQCGQCHIPFQLQASETITVNNLLTIQTKSTQLLNMMVARSSEGIQSVMIQCVLKNHTDTTLVLVGYSLMNVSDSPSKKMIYLETFQAPVSLKSFTTSSSPCFPFQQTISLAPLVTYHAGFGVKARSNSTSFMIRFYYYRKEDLSYCTNDDLTNDYPSLFHSDITIGMNQQPVVTTLSLKDPLRKPLETVLNTKQIIKPSNTNTSSIIFPSKIPSAQILQCITVGYLTKLYGTIVLKKAYLNEDCFPLNRLQFLVHEAHSFLSNDALMVHTSDSVENELSIDDLKRYFEIRIACHPSHWVPVSVKVSQTINPDIQLDSQYHALFDVELSVIPIESGRLSIPGIQIISGQWEQYNSQMVQNVFPDIRYFPTGEVLVQPFSSDSM